MEGLNFLEIISVSLVLFSVIDIPGSIPIIIDLKKKVGDIKPLKTTLASGIIMFLFLFIGEPILKLFGVDIESFALAGGIILFLIALEMVLNQNIFKTHPDERNVGSIVPLAFPLIAGAGTMTTIISLKATYHYINISAAIFLNLIFIYLGVAGASHIERRIGQGGTAILRKLFGIVLLAIAIKIFKTHMSWP